MAVKKGVKFVIYIIDFDNSTYNFSSHTINVPISGSTFRCDYYTPVDGFQLKPKCSLYMENTKLCNSLVEYSP